MTGREHWRNDKRSIERKVGDIHSLLYVALCCSVGIFLMKPGPSVLAWSVVGIGDNSRKFYSYRMDPLSENQNCLISISIQ